MSKKDITIYLKDILRAIEQIEKYAHGGKSEFMKQEIKQDAIIRQLAVIGEATKKLPNAERKKYPRIPWREIAGMRDVLIHDYAETDLAIVWNTVKDDLPPLKKAVEELLEEINQEG